MSDRRELSHSVSVRLHDILEIVGASEKMRQFHQHIATTKEIISTTIHNSHNDTIVNLYFCGSSYEGTVTPDLASDEDVIHCCNEAFVVVSLPMAGHGRNFLIVRDSCTTPGYVKLQLLMNRRPQTIYNTRTCSCLDYDRVGRACRRSLSDENMLEPNETIQGPARSRVNTYGWHYIDFVCAYKCRGIPLFATDWITRHRRYGWPSKQLIDELKGMGCLLVKAGYFNSPEKHIEWRLSFSLQERMLMKNLLPVQHKVYILLKMIKRDVLEKRLKVESLSSYHCKTSVLYMAETTPAHFWTPDNLISCLLQCLRLLLVWVRDRFCPSFFLKDQNLFDKEGFSNVAGPLEELIDSLLQNGHEFLYLIQSDRVGEMMRGEDLELYRPTANTHLNRYIVSWKHDVISLAAGEFEKLVGASSSKHNKISFFKSVFDYIQHGSNIPGHTVETNKEALQFIVPWLHFAIGMEFAANAVMYKSKHDGKELMKSADCHFQQAMNTDFASVTLAQVTILLTMEKLEECLQLLWELESRWTYRVKVLCNSRCRRVCFRDKQREDEILTEWRDMSMKKMRKYTTCEFIFLPSHMNLIPLPLRFEMFRSFGKPPGSEDGCMANLTVVDARVYLYLLLYLVSSKLSRYQEKQIAIDNLASLLYNYVNEDVRLRDTAYNLLGWIYFQEHRVEDAVWCFLMSWKIRPHHNAAKLHVLDMAFKMAQATSTAVATPHRQTHYSDATY